MRIDDLAHPRLTPAAMDMIRAAEQAPPVMMTVDAVLDAARAETGLSDFGAMDFVERLNLMLCAADEDELNALGRSFFFADMVRYASNRLRVEDTVR